MFVNSRLKRKQSEGNVFQLSLEWNTGYRVCLVNKLTDQVSVLVIRFSLFYKCTIFTNLVSEETVLM